jgi:hypothetical protein
MKIQPIMEDELFAAYYSDLTTTSPNHVKFDTINNYRTSDSIIVERTSSAGLSCTGVLDYPAAKSINVLSPVVKQKQERGSGGKHNNQFRHSSASFENIANKVFTKELVSSNLVNKSRTRSLSDYGVSRFDENLRTSLIVEKIDRLKSESGDNRNSSSAAPTTRGGKVRFSTITIQEYSIQPGVNPGGTKGCPLTIGWKPISSKKLDLDVFENARSENRRDSSQLKLVSAHREHILLEMGYPMRFIMAGTKAANQARRSRYSTISRLHSSATQEMLEGLRSTVHNLVTLGSKKRREQNFLAPYTTTETKTIKSNVSPLPRISAEKAS